MRAREIITLRGWINGSGWSYSQCYGDQVIDITEEAIKSVNWDWWETDADTPPTEGEDTLIVVDLYAEDADISEDAPLASHERWASEIWAERHG